MTIMELFCAILTSVLLWLFLTHFLRSCRDIMLVHARETAGPMLVDVKLSNPMRRNLRMIQLAIIVGMLPLCSFSIVMQLKSSHGQTLYDDFMFGSIVFICLHAIGLPLWQRFTMEFHEHGVVFPGEGRFMPWSMVVGCRWCDARPKGWYNPMLLLDRCGLKPGEYEAVTAAAARFTPVYDVDSSLIAEPTKEERAAVVMSAKRGLGWRPQFSLQSLLLLAIVIGSMSSCCGVHYRRLQPQREAIAYFKRFHPEINYIGDDVIWLDFSKSQEKPNDDDLKHIQGMPCLEYLYLSDAPVTDEGLKHLYSMGRLRSVHLRGTKVTQQGVDDLKRALPQAEVFWDPPFPKPPAP